MFRKLLSFLAISLLFNYFFSQAMETNNFRQPISLLTACNKFYAKADPDNKFNKKALIKLINGKLNKDIAIHLITNIHKELVNQFKEELILMITNEEIHFAELGQAILERLIDLDMLQDDKKISIKCVSAIEKLAKNEQISEKIIKSLLDIYLNPSNSIDSTAFSALLVNNKKDIKNIFILNTQSSYKELFQSIERKIGVTGDTIFKIKILATDLAILKYEFKKFIKSDDNFIFFILHLKILNQLYVLKIGLNQYPNLEKSLINLVDKEEGLALFKEAIKELYVFVSELIRSESKERAVMAKNYKSLNDVIDAVIELMNEFRKPGLHSTNWYFALENSKRMPDGHNEESSLRINESIENFIKKYSTTIDNLYKNYLKVSPDSKHS